jgi:hypothetical protein
MRGAAAVAVRFGEQPNEGDLQAIVATLMADKAVACCEVWTAADPRDFPVNEEERLRGGDAKIAACLLVETLRVTEAEAIAARLASTYRQAAVGAYRLLCEIRP